MVLQVHITDMTGDGQYILSGNNTFAIFDSGAHGATAFITGNNDDVSFNWRGAHGNNNRVFDHGHGSVIGIGPPTEIGNVPIPYEHAQLWDFQNDPTGKIIVDSAVKLSPDGHGGTNIYGRNFTLNVVGDHHLTMAQIQVAN